MKKIVKIILIGIILVGMICAVTLKFNIGLKYSNNVQLGINISKDFELGDIKNIVNEVFKNEKSIVQYIELYKNMVKITVKEATDEQIEELNNKINEKYEINNEVSNIEVTHNDNKINFKSIIKSIIIPVTISTVIIAVYAMIAFKKIGMFKVLYEFAIMVVGAQVILLSIYAITRLPINNITPIIAIMLYIITTTSCMLKFQNEKTIEK